MTRHFILVNYRLTLLHFVKFGQLWQGGRATRTWWIASGVSSKRAAEGAKS